MANAVPQTLHTFSARLHPRAAQSNLRPYLKDVTLAQILADETCSPISLADFESHLIFVEHSVESLHFIAWFQDYRQRFKSKSSRADWKEAKTDLPISLPSYARTELLAQKALEKLQDSQSPQARAIYSSPSLPNANDSDAPLLQLSPVTPLYTPIASLPHARTLPETKDRDADPFHAECSRIIATFLSPGAPKELLLEDTVRDTVIRNLSLTSHPDIFLPVYEEIYNLLERCSVPRFLTLATANINLPKQIYWYTIGVLNIIVGIFLALVLIMMLPTPPNYNRTYRIFPIGFLSLGAAQFYSAWRGYCSQLWLRGSTQLRVWELSEMDEETKTFVDRILCVPKKISPNIPAGLPAPSVALPLSESARPSKDVLASIAPFAIEPLTPVYNAQASDSDETVRSYLVIPATGEKIDMEMHRFNRPAVFGPEKLVLDPRIKAAHRRLLFDVVGFGLCILMIISAVLLSVPGLPR